MGSKPPCRVSRLVLRNPELQAIAAGLGNPYRLQ
jgi:hypothetical protein